jgi:hypothetical protein
MLNQESGKGLNVETESDVSAAIVIYLKNEQAKGFRD